MIALSELKCFVLGFPWLFVRFNDLADRFFPPLRNGNSGPKNLKRNP